MANDDFDFDSIEDFDSELDVDEITFGNELIRDGNEEKEKEMQSLELIDVEISFEADIEETEFSPSLQPSSTQSVSSQSKVISAVNEKQSLPKEDFKSNALDYNVLDEMLGLNHDKKEEEWIDSWPLPSDDLDHDGEEDQHPKRRKRFPSESKSIEIDQSRKRFNDPAPVKKRLERRKLRESVQERLWGKKDSYSSRDNRYDLSQSASRRANDRHTSNQWRSGSTEIPVKRRLEEKVVNRSGEYSKDHLRKVVRKYQKTHFSPSRNANAEVDFPSPRIEDKNRNTYRTKKGRGYGTRGRGYGTRGRGRGNSYNDRQPLPYNKKGRNYSGNIRNVQNHNSSQSVDSTVRRAKGAPEPSFKQNPWEGGISTRMTSEGGYPWFFDTTGMININECVCVYA